MIVGQMIVLGTGMGLSTAPATESVLGVVKAEQAGIGSAVNDATRLVGGHLGVAILGSVYASLYRSSIDTTTGVSAATRDAAAGSYSASRTVAQQLSPDAARQLIAHADTGLLNGLHAGRVVVADEEQFRALPASVAVTGSPRSCRSSPARRWSSADVGSHRGVAWPGRPTS